MRKTAQLWVGVGLAGVVIAAAVGSGLVAGRETATAAAPPPVAVATAPAGLADVVVYKSPTCGCCDGWTEHLAAAGFRVIPRDTADVGAVKRRLGVLPSLGSCHTAMVDGYVVEGHVPADVIVRLLRERPAIVGIAVPGMPAGSPGMEAARPHVPYDVIAFDASGRTWVYATR
jgi:hypothetical protein